MHVLLALPPVSTDILDYLGWIGGIAVALWLAFPQLEKIYCLLTKHKKKQDEEFQVWKKKMEDCVGGFVPETQLNDRFQKLGQEVADNQLKIKTQHDRSEEVFNALAMRVQSLEQNHTSLQGLPAQVSTLKTDHAVLSSEVRQLANSIERLADKQDAHHRETMDAVRELAFTRGQLTPAQQPGGVKNS